MSRKETGFKHGTLPDPRFESEMVARFINMVMRDGKKSVAEHIVYGAIEELEARGQAEPLEAVEKALENTAPSVEVKSRRVGGATYQVPVEVSPSDSRPRPCARSGGRRGGDRE